MAFLEANFQTMHVSYLTFTILPIFWDTNCFCILHWFCQIWWDVEQLSSNISAEYSFFSKVNTDSAWASHVYSFIPVTAERFHYKTFSYFKIIKSLTVAVKQWHHSICGTESSCRYVNKVSIVGLFINRLEIFSFYEGNVFILVFTKDSQFVAAS